VRGLPFAQVNDLRVGSARLDRLNALLGTRPGLVALTGGDDLAVGCLEVEPETLPLDGSPKKTAGLTSDRDGHLSGSISCSDPG